MRFASVPMKIRSVKLKEGVEAIHKVAPYGGRYSPFGEQAEFVKTIAEVEGVKQD